MNELFAIRDVVAGSFDGVFTFKNRADACRAFIGICSDAGTNYGRYPNDFDLYHVGSFHTDTGSVVSFDAPVFVMHGADVAAIRGGAVGGQRPPEDKPAEQADQSPSLPLDFVAPGEGSQDKSK